MRPGWGGSIGFALIDIPVIFFPAAQREQLKIHPLRESDLSPVNCKREAGANVKEVPWAPNVQDCEYENAEILAFRF